MRSSFATALLIAFVSILAQPVFAQPSGAPINPAAKSIAMAATLPGYDVVSIHENRSGREENSFDTTDDGIVVENCTLQQIIQQAYNLGNPDLISGISGPVGSARFDIKARLTNHDLAATLTDDQLQAMTIPLLAERFHLRLRLVPKKMTVYEIVIAKGGPKFKLNLPETNGPSIGVSWSGMDNTIVAKKTSISELAQALSESALHTIIIDRTGLKGEGDFSLKWTSDTAEEQGSPNSVSIFTAIQDQLGLKLQPVKLPVDTLVIEHAQMPTAD